MQRNDSLEIVRIPLFDPPILASCEEVVSPRHKHESSDRVLVTEQRLVTVPVVETPHLDTAVTATRGDQGGIIAHV